jgi:hypothetical protein
MSAHETGEGGTIQNDPPNTGDGYFQNDPPNTGDGLTTETHDSGEGRLRPRSVKTSISLSLSLPLSLSLSLSLSVDRCMCMCLRLRVCVVDDWEDTCDFTNKLVGVELVESSLDCLCRCLVTSARVRKKHQDPFTSVFPAPSSPFLENTAKNRLASPPPTIFRHNKLLRLCVCLCVFFGVSLFMYV